MVKDTLFPELSAKKCIADKSLTFFAQTGAGVFSMALKQLTLLVLLQVRHASKKTRLTEVSEFPIATETIDLPPNKTALTRFRTLA